MRRLAVFSLFIVVLVPAAAHADDDKSGENEALELAEEAAIAFEDGDYEDAFKLYDQAVSIHAHPTYIFNRARAAEKLEDCESARNDYELYLRLPNIDERAVEVARAALQNLKEQCRQRPQFSATGAIGDLPKNAPPHEAVAPKPEARPNDSRRTLYKVAAVASGVVTAGLFGLGVIEYGRLGPDGHYAREVRAANESLVDPIFTTSVDDDVCDAPEVNDPGFESVKQACADGRAATLRANVGVFGALLGGVATGVLVYKGWLEPDGRVEVSPSGPTGGLGASASVRF